MREIVISLCRLVNSLSQFLNSTLTVNLSSECERQAFDCTDVLSSSGSTLW